MREPTLINASAQPNKARLIEQCLQLIDDRWQEVPPASEPVFHWALVEDASERLAYSLADGNIVSTHGPHHDGCPWFHMLDDSGWLRELTLDELQELHDVLSDETDFERALKDAAELRAAVDAEHPDGYFDDQQDDSTA